MHPLAKRFGRALRLKRQDAGLSQEMLATKADLHRNYVGLLERGERVPTIVVVKQLASALEMTMCELLAEVER